MLVVLVTATVKSGDRLPDVTWVTVPPPASEVMVKAPLAELVVSPMPPPATRVSVELLAVAMTSCCPDTETVAKDGKPLLGPKGKPISVMLVALIVPLPLMVPAGVSQSNALSVMVPLNEDMPVRMPLFTGVLLAAGDAVDSPKQNSAEKTSRGNESFMGIAIAPQPSTPPAHRKLKSRLAIQGRSVQPRARMRINRAMNPPGMWRLPVSANVTVRGETYDLLRKAVCEWRLENGVEPGNVEADIDKFYCSQWPDRCAAEPADSQFPAGVSPEEKMSDRVLKWIAPMVDARRVPQGGWPMVSLKVAEERAKACAGCHRNVPWPSSCAGCDRSVQAASARVRSHRAIPLPHSLQACGFWGWDTASAIHLTEESLSIAPDDPRRKQAPSNCPWHAAE